MKQHITPKQLNELSGKGKRRLWEWWKPEKGNFCYPSLKANSVKMCRFDEFNKRSGSRYNYPLLSIGQMLEFLEENTESQFSIFRRTLDWKFIYEGVDYGKIVGGELCDALWEAVKERLE